MVTPSAIHRGVVAREARLNHEGMQPLRIHSARQMKKTSSTVFCRRPSKKIAGA